MCEIVHETYTAIVNCLLKQYIRFPSGAALNEIVDGFLTKWGVPMCIGAIDGSHQTWDQIHASVFQIQVQILDKS